ncbi:MAG: exopolysaccharide biosynthesis polyprenyl glycosylphosphotransferase [Candidatus Marinimicrobia bacterium]|nr:exopolysaccharide biosynthesis polyprenyl glycosylphosphotransferase [Candidatus Neomarinimicrobiota bacterium]
MYFIISTMSEAEKSTLIGSNELIVPVYTEKKFSFSNYKLLYLTGIKRFLDLIFSVLFFVIGLPFYIIFGLLIKLDSNGPVLFKQIRTGLQNNVFLLYKFRSMCFLAEAKTGPVWTAQNDPRITKVGQFLRRFRLDELPQLLNVLKGDMSLVGPRPERPFFVKKLNQEYPFYMRRLKVRPGITGLAQIKHPYDEHLEDVREKLRYDLYYIENMGLWLDLKIMIRTVRVMLLGKGR